MQSLTIYHSSWNFAEIFANCAGYCAENCADCAAIARDLRRNARIARKISLKLPKYCAILKKSELISMFWMIKTLKICLFQQIVYEKHKIQKFIAKIYFHEYFTGKNKTTL